MLCEKLKSFIRSVLKHPENGRHITLFTWTYRNWADGDIDTCLKEGPMWKAFKTMTAVDHLDFCSLALERERNYTPSSVSFI